MSIRQDNLSINSDTDSGYDPTKTTAASSSAMTQSNTKSVHTSFKQESSILSYDVNEAGYSAWKFISKFVEHVCMEGNLSDSQRQSLLNNLAEVISMQIQMLDTVYTESKRVPLRTKPKFEMLKPDFMFQGEYFIEPSPLRCHLVPDGREELSGLSNGTILLPAEGAIFLTNYRLIYRGIPVNDSLMSDAVITRSFPIASMIKDKKIGNQYKVAASNVISASVSNGSTIEFASLHDGKLLKAFFF